jgi:hypothetical protein
MWSNTAIEPGRRQTAPQVYTYREESLNLMKIK